jgi:hypothetical protein
MNQYDGQCVCALQLTQISEEMGDFSGVVFVEAMQSDEWVKHEELGSEFFGSS